MIRLQRHKINDLGVSGYQTTTEAFETFGADWCRSEDVEKLENRLEELEKRLSTTEGAIDSDAPERTYSPSEVTVLFNDTVIGPGTYIENPVKF